MTGIDVALMLMKYRIERQLHIEMDHLHIHGWGSGMVYSMDNHRIEDMWYGSDHLHIDYLMHS
jgi:hypothetical protein